MDKQEQPDRIKATLTIDLDFAKADQDRISGVLQGIIDNLWLSGKGSGSVTQHSHFSYSLKSNLPSEPMTMDRLLDLVDLNREPGEPSAREQIADSQHPDYDEALEWWEGLAQPQRDWFMQKHPGIKLVTQAWDAHALMTPADKSHLQNLK
ncbi:hypothetical protein [Pseudomonas putida]|uniref:Uncharacterized protein n=1 Tax=Pseudomonas putida TaxID=303 RepID=A0A1L7NPX6_PSEPU|nr:hypothetical protein [Pseudomonas putida]BAW27530.1 Uncharacterized protein KF715C_pC970 [Pseudomonas putida]